MQVISCKVCLQCACVLANLIWQQQYCHYKYTVYSSYCIQYCRLLTFSGRALPVLWQAMLSMHFANDSELSQITVLVKSA